MVRALRAEKKQAHPRSRSLSLATLTRLLLRC